MPKMKTDSGARKRIKVTGTGRLRRRQAFRKQDAIHSTRSVRWRFGRWHLAVWGPMAGLAPPGSVLEDAQKPKS